MAKTKPEPTAGLVVAGMLGGYLTGRATKQRPLAGVVLGAWGIAAGKRWHRSSGPGTTALLSTIYGGAFGLSHPLAKTLGAWPAVLVSTAAAAGAARVLNDKQCQPNTASPVGKSAKSELDPAKGTGPKETIGISPCWPKVTVATSPTTAGTGPSKR